MLGAGGEKRQVISTTFFSRLGIWKTGNYGRRNKEKTLMRFEPITNIFIRVH
jgi:hypothetical protein